MTAPGDVRRDYLASQIDSYQMLTAVYLARDDPANSLNTIEISRAKLLAERIAGNENSVAIPTVEEVQQNIKHSESVLVYANSDKEQMIQIAVTESVIEGREVALSAFFDSAIGLRSASVDKLLGDLRGIRLQKKDKKGSRAKRTASTIHFATHGLVVPEIHELSALVLSQFQENQKRDDGYLRMGEIAQLNLNADFVNLSACETGLGKIYGGEGIVGLTQSFLIAGANSLSVSLWQVADESTSEFMVAMYKLVESKGLNYDEAITDVKRRFNRGEFDEHYKSPFYWAPFVYYGK